MLNSNILILVLCLISSLITYLVKGSYESVRIALTSLLIMWTSIIGVFYKSNQPYSLFKMFYLFSFFFLGLAPFLQYKAGVSFFGARHLTELEYFSTNIIVILILWLYFTFYIIYYYPKRIGFFERLTNMKYSIEAPSAYRTLLLLIVSLTAFAMIFYYNNFNLISLLVRGGEEKELMETTGIMDLIITKFFQPLAMICLLFYLSMRGRKLLITMLLLVITFLTASPVGMPRFSAAALYIPLLLLGIPIFRKKNVFVVTFIFGLLIVFPFLNEFRELSKDKELSFGLDFEMFLQGHFDNYQNLGLIIHENLITYGWQLLGALLFWIPRTMWPGKPVGSGTQIANDLGFSFDNVSANYFAEGYYNFGYLGIFIFIIILSYVTAKLDKIYWTVTSLERNNFFNIIYVILIGMLFFILRGDLLSSLAYTTGFIISSLFAFKLLARK